MSLVKVKDKYQVTLPAAAREQLGLEVGDLLEAQVSKGKITLTPKSVVDREVALGRDDIRRGRTLGPYRSADEAVRAELAELSGEIDALWDELRTVQVRQRFGDPEPILRRAERDKRLERDLDRIAEHARSAKRAA